MTLVNCHEQQCLRKISRIENLWYLVTIRVQTLAYWYIPQLRQRVRLLGKLHSKDTLKSEIMQVALKVWDGGPIIPRHAKL